VGPHIQDPLINVIGIVGQMWARGEATLQHPTRLNLPQSSGKIILSGIVIRATIIPRKRVLIAVDRTANDSYDKEGFQG